jgi:hypothetical protein
MDNAIISLRCCATFLLIDNIWVIADLDLEPLLEIEDTRHKTIVVSWLVACHPVLGATLEVLHFANPRRVAAIDQLETACPVALAP